MDQGFLDGCKRAGCYQPLSAPAANVGALIKELVRVKVE